MGWMADHERRAFVNVARGNIQNRLACGVHRLATRLLDEERQRRTLVHEPQLASWARRFVGVEEYSP